MPSTLENSGKITQSNDSQAGVLHTPVVKGSTKMICLGCNHTCHQRHQLSYQTSKIWYFLALFVVLIASSQYMYLDFSLKDNH